jgi:hypothetical protein
MKKKLEDCARSRDELVGSLKEVKTEHLRELQAAKAEDMEERLYWEKQTKSVAVESEVLRKVRRVI